MNECIFCKIIAKTIPSTPVYEDEDVYAFLDIHPIQPGHTLVIPKVHADTLVAIDAQNLARTMAVVQRIGRALMDGLEVKGFNVFQNNGHDAGQDVFHLHFHLIPRYPNDGLPRWPQTEYASQTRAQEVAQRIRVGLQKV